MFSTASATDASLLVKLAPVVWGLINIYIWIIIIRVLISWFSPSNTTGFMIFLRKFTTTPLKLARAAFPLQLGGMDFSPIILILGLSFLANFLKMSMLFVGSGGSITKILPIFIFCLLMLVSTLVWFLLVIMIARVIMSLIDPSPYNPIVMLVYGLTEPLLAPFGRASKGGLDIRALIVTAIIFLFNHYALVWLIARTRTWILSTNMVIL